MITWTARIGDLLTTSHQKIIEHMACALGPEFWNKLLVVLTFANDRAPDEYYGTDGDIDKYMALVSTDKQKADLDAWIEYKHAQGDNLA